MKKINVDELKEGMMFNKPVYITGETLLVPPFVTLKKKDIDRLVRWNISEVETDGESISEAEKELLDLQKASLGKEGYELYVSFIKKIEEIFKNIALKSEEKIANYQTPLEAIAKDIIQSVEKKQNDMLDYASKVNKLDNRHAVSAVNCGILAAIVGMNMTLPKVRLLALVEGALLHDAGMLRISDDILNKKEKLKDEELRQIKTHTLISYMVISKEMKIPEEVAAIGIYHHERWDGTGYPKKLKGEEIPVFARIVSVIDAYEAMINKRPYRVPLIGYTAIKSILNDNGTHFDPNILKIFLRCMGIYPIGSFVLLNDNTICKVVDLNLSSPMRPTVVLLINESGKKLDQTKRINLAVNNEIFIIKAVDPANIEALSNE
jgi:HD-GYP domain-containing protein (c-di-GMP phosphodiesterase class II)